MAERTRTRDDGGFTLIEVIVALGIFLVVTTALLPQFLSGIRSVSKADREGVTQGILQQQIERLRGLPYRVSLGSDGSGTDQDVDLLDIYFPNLAAPATPLACTTGSALALPTTTAGTGYVTSAGAGCSYEPGAVPFYRTVQPGTDPELGTIALVYDLQFVGGGSKASPAPVVATPQAGYDSDHAVTNYPPSSQVAVTVTVLYRDRGAVVARSLATQISQHDSGPTLVHTTADATAVEVTSLAPSGAAESLTAGVLSLDASVGDISTADVSLSGVVARMATGDTTTSQLDYGATTAVSAPPSVASLQPVDVTPSWGTGCTALLCYGTSHVGADGTAGVSTDGGLPSVGSLSTPLRASVTDTTDDALTFTNIDGSTTPTHTWSGGLVQLRGTAPAATSDCPGSSASADRLTSQGYLTTTMHSGSQTVRDTAACAGTHAATIRLLPTALVPQGWLKVTLIGSYASCSVTNGTAAGQKGLTVTVEAWDGTGYQTVDPQTQVPSDVPGNLGSFIDSWSLDAGSVTASGSSVSVDVPGFTVTSTATRLTSDLVPQDDPDSAIVLTVGAASCSSEATS